MADTLEQQARDILERCGWDDAQQCTAGDVVELANLLADVERLKAEVEQLRAVITLAKMLIQPGENGPQLEGHEHFREALLGAVRGMKWLHPLEAKVERQREVLRECRQYIDASPVPSDLWASGLCRELDEVLKGPLPAIEAAKESG